MVNNRGTKTFEIVYQLFLLSAISYLSFDFWIVPGEVTIWNIFFVIMSFVFIPVLFFLFDEYQIPKRFNNLHTGLKIIINIIMIVAIILVLSLQILGAIKI